MLRPMSPFCPPAGFPPHLCLVWPLIWAQILVLRAFVRAHYGKGTLYQWSVTPWGRAFIVSIDWSPGDGEAPPLAMLAVRAQRRIEAATGGDLFEAGWPDACPSPARPVRTAPVRLRSLSGLCPVHSAQARAPP